MAVIRGRYHSKTLFSALVEVFREAINKKKATRIANKLAVRLDQRLTKRNEERINRFREYQKSIIDNFKLIETPELNQSRIIYWIDEIKHHEWIIEGINKRSWMTEAQKDESKKPHHKAIEQANKNLAVLYGRTT